MKNRLPKKCAKILLLTVLFLTSAQSAEIEIPTENLVGTKIVATIKNANKSDTLLWQTTNLETEQIENKLFIWGKPGNYEINCIIIPLKEITINGEVVKVINGAIERVDKKFKITGSSPNPDPDPGKRQVLIIRETAESSPSMAQIIVGLRAGHNAEYLKSKGHTLSILDDDAVGPNGQPSPLVTSWRSQYEKIGLPCLIIATPTSEVLYAGKINANATANQIIDVVKAHGG